MALHLDDARSPVIVVEIRGRLDDKDVETFIAAGRLHVGRAQPYAMVFVPREMQVPSFQDLKVLLQWMRDHREGLDRWYRAMALVSESPVLRGALRALMALAPLRAKVLVTAGVEEAVDWAERELEAPR